MKIRHVQEQHPPNGLPPPGLFIAHFRDAASVMLRYLSTEQTPGQGQEVRPMGSLASEAASGRNENARRALEVIRCVGDDFLNTHASTFIVSKDIRADRRAPKPRKIRNSESELSVMPMPGIGLLTVKQAAKRFPFSESAIRHMIFTAEAYARYPKAGMPRDTFIDVVVWVPRKRLVFLDEKKFLAWMQQANGR